MPMRTKDGLVHSVESAQSKDYKGVLTCGLLYHEPKNRTKWVPRDLSTNARGNPTVVAKRTSKPVTCLWCVVRRNRSR